VGGQDSESVALPSAVIIERVHTNGAGDFTAVRCNDVDGVAVVVPPVDVGEYHYTLLFDEDLVTNREVA
jgi:hypothetical protein